MRYVVALLAVIPQLFIQEAQRQFSTIADGYLLSNTSLPHITLAQFSMDDESEVLAIWDEVQNKIVTLPQPKFIGVGLSKKNKQLWGVSLSVARDPKLVALHKAVIEILKEHNKKSLGDSGELYRPHLTLARIKEPKLINFNDAILEDTSFVLALGTADENGQYLHTLRKKS